MRIAQRIEGVFPLPISTTILQGVTPYALLHIYIVKPDTIRR
jgi:hypothetical protein